MPEEKALCCKGETRKSSWRHCIIPMWKQGLERPAFPYKQEWPGKTFTRQKPQLANYCPVPPHWSVCQWGVMGCQRSPAYRTRSHNPMAGGCKGDPTLRIDVSMLAATMTHLQTAELSAKQKMRLSAVWQQQWKIRRHVIPFLGAYVLRCESKKGQRGGFITMLLSRCALLHIMSG